MFILPADATQFRGHLGGDRGKRKEKKEPFSVQYDEIVDHDSYFKEKRAMTSLSKATLDKYNKMGITLPEDLHYNVERLFQLFCNAELMVSGNSTLLRIPFTPI